MTKSKNQWGISGYEVPKLVLMDRSYCVRISQIKKKTYLDDAIRKSRQIPAPGQYNTEGHGLIDPKKKGVIA